MGAQQVKLLRSLDNAEDRTILAGEFARHAPEGTLQLRAFLSFTALVDHLIAKHAEDGVEGDDATALLSLLHDSSAVLAPPLFFFLFLIFISISFTDYLINCSII